MADLPKTIKQWQMVQPTAKNKETGEVTPGKLEMAEIPVPELKEGEVLVQIAGCGVCHTDLTYREGGINDEFPFLLGHEAAGTVSQIGPLESARLRLFQRQIELK